ncbi:IPT/TIG domain-containing protein, partial [Flavobacterium sp. XS2P39]|uniref:IPT/TIG domain-containing protein n=1 Tax=Flavobacterium sp. XS2P39 TaxID=3401725 RepID=UPI003AAEBCE6
MKKNYFKFYINLSSVLKTSKIFYLFLITFLISSTSFSQTISSFTPSNACINSGASVVITGFNFTGAIAVNFNGIAASYTIISDTEINAIVPPTATTGTISVVGSVTGTSIDTFTVDPLPAAAGTITGTSTVCQAQASVAYSVGAIANATSYFWAYSGTGATITGSTDSVSITFA